VISALKRAEESLRIRGVKEGAAGVERATSPRLKMYRLRAYLSEVHTFGEEIIVRPCELAEGGGMLNVRWEEEERGWPVTRYEAARAT